MTLNDLTPEILTNRVAKCHCGETRPSVDALDGKLAFFEYRGPGSDTEANNCAACGDHAVTHTDYSGPDKWHETLKKRGHLNDHPFVHAPRDTDVFYCGCRGWD